MSDKARRIDGDVGEHFVLMRLESNIRNAQEKVRRAVDLLVEQTRKPIDKSSILTALDQREIALCMGTGRFGSTPPARVFACCRPPMTFAVLRDCVSHFVRKVRHVAPDLVMWTGIGDHPLQEV